MSARDAAAAKKRGGGGRAFFPVGLGCGCRDVRAAVSVPLSTTGGGGSERSSALTTSSSATTKSTATTTETSRRAGKAETASSTLPSVSTSSYSYDVVDDDGECESSGPTPSFNELLRQLRDLEKSVARLSCSQPKAPAGGDQQAAEPNRSPARRRRSVSAGNAGEMPAAPAAAKNNSNCRSCSRDQSGGVVTKKMAGESVAVVKRSADPLADFRQSMRQMITEKEISGGAELRELLRCFLALNAPHHHAAILRAFADVWGELFLARTTAPTITKAGGGAAAATSTAGSEE